jgi:hypothetical protein
MTVVKKRAFCSAFPEDKCAEASQSTDQEIDKYLHIIQDVSTEYRRSGANDKRKDTRCAQETRQVD